MVSCRALYFRNSHYSSVKPIYKGQCGLTKQNKKPYNNNLLTSKFRSLWAKSQTLTLPYLPLSQYGKVLVWNFPYRPHSQLISSCQCMLSNVMFSCSLVPYQQSTPSDCWISHLMMNQSTIRIPFWAPWQCWWIWNYMSISMWSTRYAVSTTAIMAISLINEVTQLPKPVLEPNILCPACHLGQQTF